MYHQDHESKRVCVHGRFSSQVRTRDTPSNFRSEGFSVLATCEANTHSIDHPHHLTDPREFSVPSPPVSRHCLVVLSRQRGSLLGLFFRAQKRHSTQITETTSYELVCFAFTLFEYALTRRSTAGHSRLPRAYAPAFLLGSQRLLNRSRARCPRAVCARAFSLSYLLLRVSFGATRRVDGADEVETKIRIFCSETPVLTLDRNRVQALSSLFLCSGLMGA